MDEKRLEQEFYRDFEEFIEQKRIEYPKPVLVARPVDLFLMYKSVQERGGHQQVSRDNSWKFVFLDCTGNTQYSSNTGYYTRLCYERTLLEFARQRPNPFPRVYDHKDEDRLKKRHYTPSSSHNNHSSSPQLSDSRPNNGGDNSSSWDEDDGGANSEIDPDELETVLQYDYEKAVSKLGKKPPQDDEEEVEKWYEECEDQLRVMQQQYRMLQRFLTKIDRKLGMRTRFQLSKSHDAASSHEASDEYSNLTDGSEVRDGESFVVPDGTVAEISHISVDSESGNSVSDEYPKNSRTRRGSQEARKQEEAEVREAETEKLIIELSGSRRAKRKAAATNATLVSYNEQSTDDEDQSNQVQQNSSEVGTKKRRKRRR